MIRFFRLADLLILKLELRETSPKPPPLSCQTPLGSTLLLELPDCERPTFVSFPSPRSFLVSNCSQFCLSVVSISLQPLVSSIYNVVGIEYRRISASNLAKSMTPSFHFSNHLNDPISRCRCHQTLSQTYPHNLSVSKLHGMIGNRLVSCPFFATSFSAHTALALGVGLRGR